MTKTQFMNSMFATLAGAAFVLTANAALAQQASSCGPRDDVVARLSTKYGETRRGIGIGKNNRVMEVFASDSTGSWTITVTLPNGRMCLVASGQAWEDRMDDLAHLADAKT